MRPSKVRFVAAGFKTCEVRNNLVSNPSTVVPVTQVNMWQMLIDHNLACIHTRVLHGGAASLLPFSIQALGH